MRSRTRSSLGRPKITVGPKGSWSRTGARNHLHLGNGDEWVVFRSMRSLSYVNASGAYLRLLYWRKDSPNPHANDVVAHAFT